MIDYDEFLEAKTHMGGDHGFDPVWSPDFLFDFQMSLVEWACRKGRAAIFADCGLGKTPIQLVWAENVVRKTNGRVLILTPLAVAFQTIKEGSKFGIDVKHRKDGIKSSDKIVVTNYERLHYFDPNDFEGIVCDESSILKNFDGETRKAVTDFLRKRPYRLLCTATAAPNDYAELGTSSEALGWMGGQDMLNRFFRRGANYVRLHNGSGQLWEMRPHAEKDFWRWVCSWARAMRKPSDFGFDDRDFSLPLLNMCQHEVKASKIKRGQLFEIPAVGLKEQRSDLRRTLHERCGMVADIINGHGNPSIAWCNLNDEGNRITQQIPDAEQVSGNDKEERKEEVFSGFIRGDIRVLVTKPSIGGFGLNFQHCCHQTYFPSHSYEQFYQSVRRCWRFGQKNEVNVDIITTKGQRNVLTNLQRKSKAAEKMFENLVKMMKNELNIERDNSYTEKEVTPGWL